MKQKAWNHLKTKIESIFDPSIQMQIHRSPMFSPPRYWITCRGETVWDFPSEFTTKNNPNHPYAINMNHYMWLWEARFRHETLIKDYLDTPREHLLTTEHKNDHWELGSVLLAGDRRIGMNRLVMWAMMLDGDNNCARKVLSHRVRNKIVSRCAV